MGDTRQRQAPAAPRLLEHAAWADEALLVAVQRATQVAPRALREYLHILGAAETWLARIEGRSPTAAVWPDAADVDAGRLRERVAAGYSALLAGLGSGSQRRTVSYTNSAGASFTDGVEDVLLHVALHGQYHRGKVNAFLRAAGAHPQPTDYIAFVRGAPAATRAHDGGGAAAASAAPPLARAGIDTVRLAPVTMANRGDLDDIEPGEPERYLVHSNWYWHQVSLERPHVAFRLVHEADGDAAIGMVAYGARYRDRDLTVRAEGDAEIHHLVIDHRQQGRGVGRAVAALVLSQLRELPACRRVVVAIHPDNHRSQAFFAALGARTIDERNYDGDPMYAFEDGNDRAN